MSRDMYMDFPMKFQSTRQDKQEMSLSETSLALQVGVGQSMITNGEIRCHQGAPLHQYKQCCSAGMCAIKQPCNEAGQAPRGCVSCAAAPCANNPLCKPQFLKRNKTPYGKPASSLQNNQVHAKVQHMSCTLGKYLWKQISSCVSCFTYFLPSTDSQQLF